MVQCKYCDAVANAIERAAEDPDIFLWEYGEVQQNYDCVTCQKVAQAFSRLCGSFPVHDRQGYMTFQTSLWTLCLRDRNKPYHFLRGPFIGIDLVGNPASQNELGFYILRRKINVMGIKRWIDQCDQKHIGKCHTLPESANKIPDATGLIFIDVEKLCLVQQPKDGPKYRYVALSYVWGKMIDPFQTTMSNFDSLRQPNAFKLPENIWRLPNTIKDSILLTRALGVQYLWIDRFCIVQDDEVAKPHQLASMTSIYSNSYFTIAATEGEDSSYGLPGIGKRRPRTSPFEVFDFTPSCRMVASLPRRPRSRHVYHTRAWTFQEWTFSRRMLVFHDQTVTWKCQVYQEQENGQYPWRFSHENIASLTESASPLAYCSKIDEYSRKHLSNPSDILTAFDAFLTVQSRAMKTEILHGLPEAFFNNMLCWHHDADYPQRRRFDSEGNLLIQFPSWSWAGWLGPTDMLLPMQASHIRMHSEPGRLVYPCIIDVYKLPAKSQSEKRELIKDLHYYEARGMTPLIRDEELSEDDYVHYKLALPGDQATLPSITNTLYSTVIEFRTHRLIATLAEFDYNDSKKDIVSILDDKGQMIGTLDFRLSFHPLDLPKHNVQLICISVSEPVCAKHAHNRTPGEQYLMEGCVEDCFASEEDYNEWRYQPASNWQFRCYDVLWIEWEDDIAYRKAIGQVWKEEWDAADTEEVDIRLG